MSRRKDPLANLLEGIGDLASALENNGIDFDAPAHDTLTTFASDVVNIAKKRPRSERYGDTLVFIGPVRTQYLHSSAGRRTTRAMFDDQLIAANRAGLVRLHRADLVGAMDPKLVHDSEIRYMNGLAEFHFIKV